MKSFSRREMLKASITGSVAAALPFNLTGSNLSDQERDLYEKLDAAAMQTTLHLDDYNEPVVIQSIDLLEASTDAGRYIFVRVRSKDGAEGYSVAHGNVRQFHPVFTNRIAPYFIDKDARDLESLIGEVYDYRSNYKLQGLGLWGPIAWLEMAVLDLLGQVKRKPVSELMGGMLHPEVPMYIASGSRDTTPQEEVEKLQRLIEETGSKAVKFKVGGRMSNNCGRKSNNLDSLTVPGRTEALIPLTRKVLGDDITLYADANGSYDAEYGIRVGRMLEEINAGFYEEPCPFDFLEDTRLVTQALNIPVAGGEQEVSHWKFRWMIANRAMDIVQTDLHYFGGFIRCARVARMADVVGLPIVKHLSGGLGYAQMIQFISAVPNAGESQEYKGAVERTGSWFDPPITFRNGALNVPTSPGFGMVAAPDLIKNAQKMG